MTMLTSLKALLFPTPAQTGVKGDVLPAEGSAGFAQLLNSVGTTAPVAAQPAAVAPDIMDDGEVGNNNLEYQQVNVKSWHPALASATPSTAPAAPSPQTEQPHSPVQLAVALPPAEEAPAATASAPMPIVATKPTADRILASDAEAPADRVPVRHAKAPTYAVPVSGVAAATDILPVADAAPSTEIPQPEQAEEKAAAPASTVPMTIAPAPIAPAIAEQASASAPVKAHPVRPNDAAPVDALTASLPTAVSGAPETDEASSDDAPPVVQDSSPPPAQPTVATPLPPAPVVAPIVAQPAMAPAEPAPVETISVAAAAPSFASHPAAVSPLMMQPASDAPSASVTAPQTDAQPVSAAPVQPATVSNDIALPLADTIASAPLSPAMVAPEVSVTPSLPSNAAIAPVDLPVDQPAPGQPALGQPAAASAPDAMQPASQPASVTPTQTASAVPVTQPALESVSATSVPAAIAEASSAVSIVAPATPEAAPELIEIADQAPDLAQAATPTAPAKPRAEAVSLLQLVRDHMSLRAPRRTEAAAPVRDAAPDPASAPTIVPTAITDSATPLAALVQPTVQPSAPALSAIPTVDLSASLGAQVVDMGVSGQWIDGLARDIASLSANGAQGRFQINATELGPIQVDIRQGDDGAAISLTVATEAAEQALRQDSDRLKLDAGLSAVRISEVKIERAPHVAEAARADSSTSQNTAQQQSGGSNPHQGQAAGQNMGQSSAQSHMQGRGQQRENIAFGHKAGDDGAVLNHMDARDTAGGAVRARYA